MTSYHINPKTGNPNICAANTKCKLASDDGVVPPHYESKSEAEKSVKAQSSEASEAIAEDSTVTPEAETSETVETIPEAATLENLPEPRAVEKITPADDEPRGPESFEKVVKIARKTVIELVKKKRIARVKLKKLNKKIKKKARKLKSIRSRIKKHS